jgi:C-terminal processing protease CtpA/Prc
MSSTEYGGEFSFNEDYTVTLSAANIGNHPVVASDIIEYGGRRVGYVAYNSFTRGPVDSSTEYDADLERVFETFETEGINELVVDLRYNGGGSVSSCQKLLSMIAPKEKLGQKAFTLRHNASIEEQLGDDEKIIKLLENYSNVNMSRVYVITSDMTASASEMVIVGLRGLDVDVTVVGIDTEGKNVGMDVMGKHIDGYDYTFAPITFQIYNAKGFTDYSQGIRADYKVDEWEDLRSDGWKPLGDPEEVVLKMVLNLIDGSRAVAEPTRSSARPKGVEKIRFTDPQRSMGALIYADDNFNQK